MPDWKHEVRQRLAALQLAPTRENALVEEWAQHLEELYEAFCAEGDTPEQAAQQVREELLSHEWLQRELRQLERISQTELLVPGANRRGNMIAEVWQDLRFGARMLMKQKGLTAIAVLSLALGIGANTALFSVVDAMLLKRLPVKEPERLVLFQSVAPREFSTGGYNGSNNRDPVTGQTQMTSFPYQSYQHLRAQQSVLSDVFAFGYVRLNVLAEGQADNVNGQTVTGNYHAALGVQPLLGRLLKDDDDKASAQPVAVLSYRYWQKRFGDNASIIGKQINLNNVAFMVIGVTPPGFEGTGQIGETQDVTIPLA